MANGTIKKTAVNIPYTVLNTNVAYAVSDSIVFVYIIDASVSGNQWKKIGTLPSELHPPAEVNGMCNGGAYANGYWNSCGVKTNGDVQIGFNGTGTRVNLYGTIIYPYPS